ncbi:MAG: nuclear transport factor 2 family protein [Leptolyngbya sp. SIO1D8]|nr:nuclear transport factor 2 family protein [Leptolyngbya sp. SIO1D8]
MTTLHPNISLLERLSPLIPHDLASAKGLLADNFVWHYFNSTLPELEGDYVGIEGLQTFFQKLGALTENTFTVKDKQVFPIGEELVVVHAEPNMTFEGQAIAVDAAVVWRVVNNQIVEAWDIPAVNTIRPQS